MGIYIKEMDMPKSCIECLLHGESACKAFTTIEPWTFKDDERAAFCPLTEVTEPKWIPCSERLPEEGQMVLTTIRGHNVIISQDGETLEEAMERVWNEVCYVSVGFIGSDGWYGADGFPQIVHPIAWMPLPKPYREESEEEE